MIFTIPALVLMGYWPDFDYWWVLGIAGLGGLLGVLFSVPLRRTMIVEEPLPFPEGKAAAEVLKAGENPGPGLKILGISAAIGALVKLAAANGLRAIPDSWAVAGYFANNKVIGYLGTGLSPALLGVGYIVGLNVGIVVLSGAILSLAHRHPAVPRLLPRQRPGAGREHRRRPPPTRRSPSGRPRSASSASARCWSAAYGPCSRCATRCWRASAAALPPRARARPGRPPAKPTATCR